MPDYTVQQFYVIYQATEHCQSIVFTEMYVMMQCFCPLVCLFSSLSLIQTQVSFLSYSILHSNRVFTEGTCKLLNLVISDLVDEDCVLHRRNQAVSALVFGVAALLSKPGQTLAPLIGTSLLALQTGKMNFMLSVIITNLRILTLLRVQGQKDYM